MLHQVSTLKSLVRIHWEPRQYGYNEIWFLVYFMVFRPAFQPMRQVGSESGSEALREQANKLKAFLCIKFNPPRGGESRTDLAGFARLRFNFERGNSKSPNPPGANSLEEFYHTASGMVSIFPKSFRSNTLPHLDLFNFAFWIKGSLREKETNMPDFPNFECQWP